MCRCFLFVLGFFICFVTGFLRDVTTVIANEKMNVLGVKSHTDPLKDLSLIDIDLLVISISTLQRVIAKLNDLPKVTSAQRI